MSSTQGKKSHRGMILKGLGMEEKLQIMTHLQQRKIMISKKGSLFILQRKKEKISWVSSKKMLSSLRNTRLSIILCSLESSKNQITLVKSVKVEGSQE